MNGTLKKCPSCGKFFTCQGNDDCWCENMHIHKKDFLRLSETFNNCICQRCMEQYSEE